MCSFKCRYRVLSARSRASSRLINTYELRISSRGKRNHCRVRMMAQSCCNKVVAAIVIVTRTISFDGKLRGCTALNCIRAIWLHGFVTILILCSSCRARSSFFLSVVSSTRVRTNVYTSNYAGRMPVARLRELNEQARIISHVLTHVCTIAFSAKEANGSLEILSGVELLLHKVTIKKRWTSFKLIASQFRNVLFFLFFFFSFSVSIISF